MAQEKIYELEWKEKFVDGVKHMEQIISGEEFSELHVLDMFYCEIGVDGAKYFKDMVSAKPLPYLQELNLCGNALTDDGFCAIIDAMIAGALPKLLYINADDNKLTSISITYLKKLIEAKTCPELQAVSLNLNSIGEEGCKELASAIELSECLWSKINLKENQIGDNGFNALMDVLKTKGSNINEINFSQNGLSTACINRVGSFITEKRFPFLIILDMSYNYSDDMLEGLLNGFASGNASHIRRLVISGMCMESTGCNHLREVLKAGCLPEVQELLIAENNIMEKGVLAVLLALREVNSSVHLLDLSWNNLTDDGAKFIINFLNGKSNTGLSVMLLQQNDIAFKITELQNALNKRGIRSPHLREQWL